MAIRVAINGFGRIGRNILRAIIENGRTDIQVVAINDLGSVETNAHLMRYDSVHGTFGGEVKVDGDTIDVGQGPIRVYAIRDPKELPWGELDIDIAMECTGIFTARDKAGWHLEAGAKRVLISAPGANADLTVVYGVSHKLIGADHKVVSNGSCTTNCLAPVAKILNDSVGIQKGFMTTIHAYTGDQPTLIPCTRTSIAPVPPPCRSSQLRPVPPGHWGWYCPNLKVCSMARPCAYPPPTFRWWT